MTAMGWDGRSVPYQRRGQGPMFGHSATCADCRRRVAVNLLNVFVDHEDVGGFPCIGEGAEPRG